MAKTVVPMRLSESSIQATIDYLNNYKNSLQGKCEELVSRLLAEGENIAKASLGKSPIGGTVTLNTEINAEQMGCKGVLIAVGEIKQQEGYEPFNLLLAIEFGAGIHYNPQPNPKSGDFGLGVGTFPGQTHAFDDGWWYFGNDDKWHYSQGIKATMPMYNALMEIVNRYRDIAKQVFKS